MNEILLDYWLKFIKQIKIRYQNKRHNEMGQCEKKQIEIKLKYIWIKGCVSGKSKKKVKKSKKSKLE